jgi:hypothetical protein
LKARNSQLFNLICANHKCVIDVVIWIFVPVNAFLNCLIAGVIYGWKEGFDENIRSRFYEAISAKIYGQNLILSNLSLKLRSLYVFKYHKIQDYC